MLVCSSFVPELGIEQEDEYVEYSVFLILREYVTLIFLNKGNTYGLPHTSGINDWQYLFSSITL
jgi:hypothetical protein